MNAMGWGSSGVRWMLMAALSTPAAWAAPVLLASMGTRASFSEGGASFTLQVGETGHGIRLVSLAADSAVIEADGKRTTLKMGQEPYTLQRDPASLMASKAPRIVLSNLDLQGLRYPVDQYRERYAAGLCRYEKPVFHDVGHRCRQTRYRRDA